MEIKSGATRKVLLTNKFAIKFPSPENFLEGIKCNKAEASKRHEFACPILFNFFNLAIVMPKCEALKWNFPLEILKPVAEEIGAELKTSSFGLLNGKIVCFDYAD